MKDPLLWTILNIFSTLLFQSELVYGTNVILGKTASLDCFDPALAIEYTTLYVDVTYQSLLPNSKETMIASYQVKSSKKKIKSSRFQNRLNFLKAGILEIKDIRLRDEGTYTCHSRSFGLDDVTEISTITVYVPPTVTVKKSPTPLVVGSPLVTAAECTAEGGKPPAKVHWTNTLNLDFSEKMVNDSSKKLTTMKSYLQLEPIKLHNKQGFTCTVDHPAFPKNSVNVIYLNVTYPPSPPIIMVDNDNEYLTCDADGNPPTKYTWTMPKGAPSATMYGAKVKLLMPNDPAHRNDTYVCMVSNGIGEPQSKSITTNSAITAFALTKQANVSTIIGAVIGGVVALFIIIFLVYFFVVKRNREKDDGPYQQRNLVDYNTEAYGRSFSQHSNSMNKHRPSSLAGASPNEKLHGSFHSESSSDSDGDEGQHDIDLENDPATTLVHPAPHDDADLGFRTGHQRLSTSPGSRKRRTDSQMQREADRLSPTPAPRQINRYDVPPSEGVEMTNLRAGMGDNPDRSYQGDAYPFQQPPHVGYPERQQQPPHRTDSMPHYESKYAQIDHSGYRKGSGSRRPPAEEPVEYAQIRHGSSHLV